MFEEFESQGLVMLALTDEGNSLIERFMEHTPMPYPIATGASSAAAYGVKGIPQAFLVDHKGEIVWEGMPHGNGWVRMLPKLLAEASDASPAWEPGAVGPALEKAAAKARAGKLKDAIKLAERARKDSPAEAERFLTELEESVNRRLERALALAGEARYFEAAELLAMQAKAFKGTPYEKGFVDQRYLWVSDKELKAVMALDKKRLAANELARSGKADKARKALAKLLEEAADTALEGAIAADLERAKLSR